MYTPMQKLIYPFTTPLIILLSLDLFSEEIYLPGIGMISYWVIWAAFGLLSLIILMAFYNSKSYKATPRMVTLLYGSSS
jgi:hypothetical protein